MVVITKPSTTLIKRLKDDFPKLKFVPSELCKWSPSTNTVYYAPLTSSAAKISLIHELAHALLGHTTFVRDIELMQKEVEAWQYAKDKLSASYQLVINQADVDEVLETYRDWLYKRSLCPNCGQTGLQIKTNTYNCLNCRCLWHVNDARQCRLRRLKLL
jgi:hypothetical protein